MIEVMRADITSPTVDAFPAIATGVYHFPKPLASEVATESMRRHEGEFERIVACVFDAERETLYRQRLAES
jgi:O-acetyl-ADP-ribose deacetylase (regulator of RNase III)